MKNYTREKLDGFGIHALRDLAREFGVQSPTNKKKETLISLILEIQDGTREKTYNITKKGRPVKAGFMHSAAMQFPENFNENEYSKLEFQDVEEQMLYNVLNASNGERIIARGIVEYHKSGYGILRVANCIPNSGDCYINPSFLFMYSLKSGDEIEAIISSSYAANCYVADILTINGEKVFDYKPFNRFENMPYNSTDAKINVNLMGKEVNLLLGGRNIVYSNEVCENNSELVNFIKKFNNVKVVAVNFLTTPEEKGDENVINIPFNLKRTFALTATALACDKAKRLVEAGNNVVFIINRFNDYVKFVNDFYNNDLNSTNLSLDAFEDIKNTLLCAKFNSDKENLTFVGIAKHDDIADKFISSIKNIANVI